MARTCAKTSCGANREDWPFLNSVLAGVYTVPGDGIIDFVAVLKELRGYSGWVVVEAEQDPEKANPLKYAEWATPICAASRPRPGSSPPEETRQKMTASKLLVRPDGRAGGRVIHVTPESAGWTYVGFDLHRLAAGETPPRRRRTRGLPRLPFRQGTVEAGGALGALGGRTSPFDGKPWSVYVPAGSDWRVTADDL